MRTCVRVVCADDPARRPRRVLCVRRATGCSAASQSPRHRRRGGGARRQLRGQGARRSHRDGRGAGAPAVPARPWSSRRGCRRTPRRARPSSRCSSRPPRSSRGSRSTRPSSTFAVSSGSRGRRRRSQHGCARRVRERVGLPITVGVARTKFLAKVASGVAKPDGLLVVPPDGELAFLHPLPVERLWGVGRVTAAKLRGQGDRHGRRGCPGRRGGAGVDARARRGPASARPRAQSRSQAGAGGPPSTVDRRAACARALTANLGRAGRRARRARRPPRPPAAGSPAGVPDRRACDCVSMTTRERLGRTRSPKRPRRRRRSSPRGERCSPRPCR